MKGGALQLRNVLWMMDLWVTLGPRPVFVVQQSVVFRLHLRGEEASYSAKTPEESGCGAGMPHSGVVFWDQRAGFCGEQICVFGR